MGGAVFGSAEGKGKDMVREETIIFKTDVAVVDDHHCHLLCTWFDSYAYGGETYYNCGLFAEPITKDDVGFLRPQSCLDCRSGQKDDAG